MSVSTTLTAPVAPTDTTISIASAGDLPLSPPMRLAINGEQITVIDGFGTTTFAVQRDLPNAETIITRDLFDRIVDGSWGDAPEGDHWTNADNGNDRIFAVNGGWATVEDSNTTGTPITAPRLPTVEAQTNAELRFRFIADKVADTDNYTIEARPREYANSTRDRYIARARVLTNGDMDIRLLRRVNGVETNIGSLVTKAGLFTVDAPFWLRAQAYGTYPTTLNAKLWKESDGEPGSWDCTGTDGTALMQTPGYGALRMNAGAGATNLPVTFGIADWYFVRLPTGRTHASGDEVVLVEDWPLPPVAVVGNGPPTNAPASASMYVDSSVKPPITWMRVGSEWYVQSPPGYVSQAKWG